MVAKADLLAKTDDEAISSGDGTIAGTPGRSLGTGNVEVSANTGKNNLRPHAKDGKAAKEKQDGSPGI